MIRWNIVRHRVALAGWVTDGETGKFIEGASVVITAVPAAFERVLRFASKTEPLDRTQTRADGLFFFLNLPDGEYTCKISEPSSGRRYAGAQVTATVSRDDQGNLKMATVKAALQPTTVKGKITGSNHRTGVVLAQVRVKGSGERTYTDAQGKFVLAGIEPGTRTVQIFAQGYNPASRVVKLAQPGASETVNVVLSREAS
jgi:hypothetical protein